MLQLPTRAKNASEFEANDASLTSAEGLPVHSLAVSRTRGRSRMPNENPQAGDRLGVSALS